MLREDVAKEQVVPFANGYIQELLGHHSLLQVPAMQPAILPKICSELKFIECYLKKQSAKEA